MNLVDYTPWRGVARISGDAKESLGRSVRALGIMSIDVVAARLRTEIVMERGRQGLGGDFCVAGGQHSRLAERAFPE